MKKLPAVSHWVMLRLLLEGLSSSVAGAAAGTAVGAFALLFAIMTEASAAAFFRASRASRALSATNLPAATRLGFVAAFAVGVGEVACCVISPCALRLFGRHFATRCMLSKKNSTK